MRFERTDASRSHPLRPAARALFIFTAALAALAALPASAATLDRIRETGTIKLGYLADARPFSFRNDAGGADGYSVELCKQVPNSVFALYASGMEAVMGGMLVLGIVYIVWGFVAPRFAASGAPAGKV